MVRLIRTGSVLFFSPSLFLFFFKGEGDKSRSGKGNRKTGRTVPPRLSLSAGFTWMGLFICDGRRKTRGDTVNETAAEHKGL